MIFILVLMGGVALFGVTVTFLDYLGRRQRQKSPKH